MKRLITIFVIFAVMIGFGIFELVYSTSFYQNQYDLLVEVRQSFDADPKSLDRKENIEVFERAVQHFEKGKPLMLVLSNHNTIKYIDEKLVSITELIRMNQEYDAFVALAAVTKYISELKNDTLPSFGNLL